jgi:hypothetical protein
MLDLLEFLGEALDLSELTPVVFMVLVGLVICYGLFGAIGVAVLVVSGLVLGLLMRPQPFVTLELESSKSAQEKKKQG